MVIQIFGCNVCGIGIVDWIFVVYCVGVIIIKFDREFGYCLLYFSIMNFEDGRFRIWGIIISYVGDSM